MYITVLQFLANFTTIWSGLVAFADAVDSLTTKVSKLQAQVAIQSTHIVGYATAKKGKKKVLINSLMEVIGALKAYATVINDPILFNFADYTRSKLSKLPDAILIQAANLIHAKALSLLVPLGAYGVNAAKLDALQLLITGYADFVEQPRLARIARKTATGNIKTIITEIDAILKTVLDMLIFQFEISEHDFFTGFKSAREIIDLGHHHLPFILTGTLNSGQVLNIINSTDSHWVVGKTVKIKNTSSGGTSSSGMYFFLADSAGEGWSGHGWHLMPGHEVIFVLTAVMYKNFLNTYNPGGNDATFEVTITAS